MRRLIIFLLGLLGLSAVSCDRPENLNAYGTPNVLFSLKARVVDEAGNPIKGIEVDVNEHYWFDNNCYSDENGYFDVSGNLNPGDQYKVRFIDIDGAENGGEFETLELDITDSVKRVADGSNTWCEGVYKAELGEVTLKLKQSTADVAEE